MIAIERRGRLGNQMFQFAFGLCAATRLGTEFVMAEDELRERFALPGRSQRAGRIMRAAEYRIRRRAHPFPSVKVSNDAYDRPENVLAGLADDTTYSGYFQSERFFADVAVNVRSAFQPRPEHQRAFRASYGHLLESGYICCHVRRGDYLTFRGGVALPASYYRECLDRLEETSALPVVVVGDDLEWARSELAGTAPRLRFERNTDAVDLLLLIHANAVVASNSSFAWWGAWLGERPDRAVLAPRFWLGAREATEWPPAVIPERWTQVTVSVADRAAATLSGAGEVIR